jgi:8-oxo-dGTP pyrophosphatase MutT (NUDIX family)
MNDTQRSTAEVKDLLLEEYRNLADCFWKNEQSGETRVNLFIGLVAGVSGALVKLAVSEHTLPQETVRLIVTGGLSVLSVLGVVTLFRMLSRNETTDGYKKGADAVRQLFKDHFDGDHILLHYDPFGKADLARRTRAGQGIRIRRVGGLTHTVAVVNSILLTGLVAANEYPLRTGGKADSPALLWTAGAFCVSLFLQFAYVNNRERRAKSRPRPGEATHAGGIVYRRENGVVQYLLAGPRKDVAGEWLWPKGHIESGEGHGEAALREVREETGVVARLVCLLGRVEFNAPAVRGKERVRAKYYLMEFLYQTPPSESRRREWFGFEEARGLLKHEENKYLLDLAKEALRPVAKGQAVG